ncbi:hypothetical protein ACTHGU_00560 [Chitinophagaceae bacterium MMS25-I14]
MKGLENSTYLTLYIISNAVAILMLLAAWKAPRVARVLFFCLFAWASWKNWTTAIRSPQYYMEYASLTFSDLYRFIIHGWFSEHITLSVCIIAVCQALIAISMLLKESLFRAGTTAAVIFLLAIAPLGVGSAFPCTLIMAIAIKMLSRTARYYIWAFPKRITG